MAPKKKAQKISLNEFLGDGSLGSWADEMDSLPSAPAARTDEERANDRYGRRGDDFLSSRPDRGARDGPPREDLPMPTAPPYTAFIGNLAFDLTEMELEDFFASSKTKTIKIIKDRDEKPKGFGYVEFEDLDGLKDALAKSGSNFSGRTIRVSVAEPPKERGGFGGAEDDAKFDNPWRRDGPLPDLPNSRDSSRRRFDGPRPEREERLPSLAEGPSDWRSASRPVRATEPEPSSGGSVRRKGPGFPALDGQAGAADKEEAWTMGSKFKPAPSVDESANGGGSRFGSLRGRGDMGPPGPPKEPVVEESDWRSATRPPRPTPATRNSTSPTSSAPPTPQLARRKLELLPRSGNASGTPSPLASPKIGPTPSASLSASTTSARSNPFGAAKPVDVSTREKEVTERIEEKEREVKERLTMSRTSSRAGSERPPINRTRTPPVASTPHTPTSPRSSHASPALKAAPSAPGIRPTISFANAAAKKELASEKKSEEQGTTESAAKADEPKSAENKEYDEVKEVTEKVAEVSVLI